MVQRRFIFDPVVWISDKLSFVEEMRKSLTELPSRLLLLNFRALGSAEEVVYIQHWVKKRHKEIA